MTQHPPLMEKMAVKPEVVAFTLETLTVRCPDCQSTRTWVLAQGKPPAGPYCLKCGRPWKWA